MTKTIEQALADQDASDMFFNDERVLRAFALAVSNASGAMPEPEAFAKELVADFGKENALVIATDFLKRV